jgi:hypothetical protein
VDVGEVVEDQQVVFGVHVPGVPKVTVRNLRHINDLRQKFVTGAKLRAFTVSGSEH